MRKTRRAMSSLGIRCYPTQYVFVLLAGSLENPTVVKKGICKLPPELDKADALKWVRTDLQELLNEQSIRNAFIKTVEGNAQTKDPSRLHIEGVALEACRAHASSPDTETVVAVQIKKRTGFNSLARYLSQLLKSDSLASVSSATYSDAALAALCGLPKDA